MRLEKGTAIIHGIKFEGIGNSAADGDVKLKTLVIIVDAWNNPVFDREVDVDRSVDHSGVTTLLQLFWCMVLFQF